MKTSEKGIAALERHEGVVLKAYLCPAGKWTIGPGLTRASGVVDPKRGMTITKAEASELLAKALARNYEPRVTAAMPGAKQHEFDAGISFDYNTGAINRASWVRLWAAVTKNWEAIRGALMQWRKGGGKVLPGLERRRAEEFNLLKNGIYLGAATSSWPKELAKTTVPLDGQVEEIRAAFIKLGYPPGNDHRGIAVEAVRAFQRDHELTVDGILGRATLSTLQRRLDATAKTTKTAAGGAVGGGAAGAGTQSDVPASADWAEWILWIVVAVVVIRLAWLAWSYRDVIAAKIAGRMPRLAATLRRF